MVRLENKLLELETSDKIAGDFSKQAGKVLFNALAALLACWFLQYQKMVLMIQKDLSRQKSENIQAILQRSMDGVVVFRKSELLQLDIEKENENN
jgi:hypothetical protein